MIVAALWELRAALRELWRSWSVVTVVCYLVRTGEYNPSYVSMMLELTKTGERQAADAAKIIREKAGGAPVLVLRGSTELAVRYRETTQIIAKTLGVTPCDDSLARYAILDLVNPETETANHGEIERLRWKIWSDAGRRGRIPELHAVIVLDGTYLKELLGIYSGPHVTCDDKGPPFGSVHKLLITYDRRLPWRLITRYFGD